MKLNTNSSNPSTTPSPTTSTSPVKFPFLRNLSSTRSVSSISLPKRLLLVRHGQSEGNVNEDAYQTIPDWKIPLTARGEQEAFQLGQKIKDLIGDEPIYIYYSPYLRTRQTMEKMMESLQHNPIYGIREEPRITEQQFGNFQSQKMRQYKQLKRTFGNFYYRYPEGESGLDVYNRVTSFIGSLFREWYTKSLDPNFMNCNVIIVTHGLSLRLFIMRWFQFTVHQFEQSRNPNNCAIIMMERKPKITPYSPHGRKEGAEEGEEVVEVEGRCEAIHATECLKLTEASQAMLHFVIPKKTMEQYRSSLMNWEQFNVWTNFTKNLEEDLHSIPSYHHCHHNNEESSSPSWWSLFVVMVILGLCFLPGLLLP